MTQFIKGVTYKDRGGSTATVLDVCPSHLIVHSHHDGFVATYGLDGRLFWSKDFDSLENSDFDLLAPLTAVSVKPIDA